MSNNARPPVNIGQVIYEATAFDPKNWTGAAVRPDAMPAAVRKLFMLLNERQIDYLLVGGIALLQYVALRNTKDIDLIIAATALKKLPEILLHDQNMFFASGMFESLPIDFLLTKNSLFKRVQTKYAVLRDYDGQMIRSATVGGLLLLKLYALPSLYRQANFARVGIYEGDILALMSVYKPSMDSLLDELSKHLSESDLLEVRTIVAEIQHRIERKSRFDKQHDK